jgi:hypothetical protein
MFIGGSPGSTAGGSRRLRSSCRLRGVPQTDGRGPAGRRKDSFPEISLEELRVLGKAAVNVCLSVFGLLAAETRVGGGRFTFVSWCSRRCPRSGRWAFPGRQAKIGALSKATHPDHVRGARGPVYHVLPSSGRTWSGSPDIPSEPYDRVKEAAMNAIRIIGSGASLEHAGKAFRSHGRDPLIDKIPRREKHKKKSRAPTSWTRRTRKCLPDRTQG